MVVTKSREVGEMRRCRSNGTNLQLCGRNKSKILIYCMMIIDNNISITGDFLRGCVSHALWWLIW